MLGLHLQLKGGLQQAQGEEPGVLERSHRRGGMGTALVGERSYCMSGGWRSFSSRTRCRTCSRNCEGGTAPAGLEEGVEPAGSEGGAASAGPEGRAAPAGIEGGAVPAGPWEELLQQGRTKEVLLEKRGGFGMSEGRTAQAGPKDKSVPARLEGGAALASQREEMGNSCYW